MTTVLVPSSFPARVYARLKRRIINGKLPLGAKLTEDRLAAELGVSRTPIREALNRLAQDGLVTIIPYRGAFVTTLSEENVRDLFEIREGLEGMAARLAVERMTAETLARLRWHLEEGMAASRRNGYVEYSHADREFHETLAQASGNRQLAQALQALADRIHLFRRRSVTLPGRAEKSFREHMKVIQALTRRNPDLAEARIRKHIQNVKADLLRAIAQKKFRDSGTSLQGSNFDQKITSVPSRDRAGFGDERRHRR